VTRKIILLFALVAGVAAFPLAASAQSDSIPSWVKNTAGWWADDQISETEFVNSMEYLIDSGIIQVSSQSVDVSELTIGFIPIEKADELTPKAESLEKFLEQTRHIEYQFARDKHGNTVHIFERECSIQRRNQKLIEQTPSPIVDQETRDRIGKLVVNAAQAVDYTNLGTAEFLRAENGEFYFLEINARLLVEHPITEFVSGLDLVKLQLDIANGEPIPFKQSDLKMNGYAIECRINAEDTFLDFAPSTGPIPAVTIPSGPGVRCDSYLYPGCTVSPFYDSLMAKLVTWGQTFDESRLRMLNALDDFYIQGVETSIPLYKTILETEEYKNGELSTNFLKRFGIIDRLKEDLKNQRKDKHLAAIAAAVMHSTFFQSRVKASNVRNPRWKSRMDR